MSRAKRPSWLFLLFWLLMVGVLVTLGAWQMQRKVWKETIIAEMTERQSWLLPLVDIGANYEQLEYAGVYGQGHYDATHVFEMPGKVHNGKMGRDILMPFILENGVGVMVNIGWLPDGVGVPALSETYIEGYLRLPRAGYFTPANDADKNAWYWADMGAMQQKTGTMLAPFVVYRKKDGPGELRGGLQASAAHPDLPNNHLQYAVTWFSLAGVALIIGALYWRRNRIPDAR